MRDTAEGDDVTSDNVYRKVMWRIMPLLVICYVVSFIDRANVGVAKIQFVSDLGFTNIQYGIGAGIFYLGYVFLEIPSNYYLNKIGIRKTILRIMVLWGICCILLAAMDSAFHFYILRFLLGAAEAGFFPGILLYLTYWIPARRRARFTAIFMASIAVAGLVGGPIAGLVMSVFGGVGSLRGWQWLFIVEGVPAVLLGVAAFFWLDDRPRNARWLSDYERSVIINDLTAEDSLKGGHAHTSFAAVFRDGRFYGLALLGFAIMVSTGGVFFWLPTTIRDSGISDVLAIGLLSALPFVFGIVMQYVVARHSDIAQERRGHAIAPALVAAAGWFSLPFVADSTVFALIALTLATSGTLAAMGPFWSLPPTFLSGAATASGIALITTLAGIGNFFSPILVGWLVDETGSLAAGQFYFSALLVLGALVLLLQRPAAATELV